MDPRPEGDAVQPCVRNTEESLEIDWGACGNPVMLEVGIARQLWMLNAMIIRQRFVKIIVYELGHVE